MDSEDVDALTGLAGCVFQIVIVIVLLVVVIHFAAKYW